MKFQLIVKFISKVQFENYHQLRIIIYYIKYLSTTPTGTFTAHYHHLHLYTSIHPHQQQTAKAHVKTHEQTNIASSITTWFFVLKSQIKSYKINFNGAYDVTNRIDAFFVLKRISVYNQCEHQYNIEIMLFPVLFIFECIGVDTIYCI